jgi:hypothetical protein
LHDSKNQTFNTGNNSCKSLHHGCFDDQLGQTQEEVFPSVTSPQQAQNRVPLTPALLFFPFLLQLVAQLFGSVLGQHFVQVIFFQVVFAPFSEQSQSVKEGEKRNNVCFFSGMRFSALLLDVVHGGTARTLQ